MTNYMNNYMNKLDDLMNLKAGDSIDITDIMNNNSDVNFLIDDYNIIKSDAVGEKEVYRARICFKGLKPMVDSTIILSTMDRATWKGVLSHSMVKKLKKQLLSGGNVVVADGDYVYYASKNLGNVIEVLNNVRSNDRETIEWLKGML